MPKLPLRDQGSVWDNPFFLPVCPAGDGEIEIDQSFVLVKQEGLWWVWHDDCAENAGLYE